jgi:hypothetical protein
MIASEDAHAYNRDGNRTLLRQEKLSLAVAGEIVNANGGKSIWAVLSSQFSVLSSQFSVLSSQFSVLGA